jgi:hypothetical protein
VIAVPLIVADTVFSSASLEASDPVATPLELVTPEGCVSVFPVPDEAKTTVAPLTGFPKASFAVAVIVDNPDPATKEVGEALNVDCEADTGPAVTVTDAVWMIPVPPAFAEMVFSPAPVEVKVLVKTPLPLVVPEEGVNVLPGPVADITTVAPLTGLPLASLAVTVTVDEPVPAVNDAGAAETVDCEPDTPPPPLPGGPWHPVLPESVNVCPVRGMNFHA